MRIFPGRQELLDMTPGGAIALLDSVLGLGYRLRVTLGFGIWIDRHYGGWRLATEPPVYPGTVAFIHGEGYNHGRVFANIILPGQIEFDGQRAWEHDVTYIPNVRFLNNRTNFSVDLTGRRRIIDMARDLVDAVYEYADPVMDPEAKHPDDLDGDEYVALGGQDIQEVALAVQRLRVKRERVDAIIDRARDRLEMLVAGTFKKEEK